jgi:hypothetical protein
MARRATPTLAEVIERSTRVVDVSGLRQQMEEILGREPRGPSDICRSATIPLLPMLSRTELIKERIHAAGGDFAAILDDYDNPQHRALADAWTQAQSDAASAWDTWKKACMRRNPNRD